MMRAVFTVFGQREERKKRFPPKDEQARKQAGRYPGIQARTLDGRSLV